MGLDDPMYAAVLDIDSGKETIYADDVEIGDIIWMGPQPTIASKAALVGVADTAPYAKVDKDVKAALKAGRKVHYIAPSRYFNTLRLMQMLGRARIDLGVSEVLTKAIISMRLIKEDVEIAAIDAACDLGFKMHSVARDSIRPGIVEQDIVGKMEGVALAEGWGVSFPTILTQHGETLHNHLHDKVIEPGKLMVIDAGVESNEHYASDFTRTYPTSGKFTPKQREVYQIVCDCNELAFSLVKPGITYREVHLAVARKMLEGLSALDLVKGDLDEMVALGIAGLFQPHGLGHNMGLDVHPYGPPAEARPRDHGRARHLLHPRPHRAVEERRHRQGLRELRQTGILLRLRRHPPGRRRPRDGERRPPAWLAAPPDLPRRG